MTMAIKLTLFGLMVPAALIFLLNQVRKPTPWIGSLFLSIMNYSHSSLTDWGLGHVLIEEHFTILDVGCGGGRTIQKLAAFATKGTVFGVDYSRASVAASTRKNAELIKAGRVQIHHASVSQLPFPDAKFDLVTAVETYYYWPDLVKDLQEILRVLKPGGYVLTIAESYAGSKNDKLEGPVMKLLKSSTPGAAKLRELLSTAGYMDAETVEERNRGWICASGKKPCQPG